VSSRIPEVTKYLEESSPERRAALTRLRSLIFEVVPDAVETMKYRMPTYEYRGHVLCAFASQKRYMSVYLDTEVVRAHREELEGLSVGKSCVRFKRQEQLPWDTIRAMLAETVANWGIE
jgi:uncharacterized protein YdhG (YjbR/CyaY superfamily)